MNGDLVTLEMFFVNVNDTCLFALFNSFTATKAGFSFWIVILKFKILFIHTIYKILVIKLLVVIITTQ